MHERASGLDLGWDRSLFVGEDCVGLGAIDLGEFLPLDFPFGIEPFPFPFFPLDRFILFRLPLIVMPFIIFVGPSRLIPLGILGFRLHWARTL